MPLGKLNIYEDINPFRKSEKQIIVYKGYRGYPLSEHVFIDVTPDSYFFGTEVRFTYINVDSSPNVKLIGSFKQDQLNQLIKKGPQRAADFLKNTLNYEYIDKNQPVEIDKS